MKTLNYPLIFTYEDTLLGDGFAARVVMNGRALMTVEDDGDVWIYGITPSGMGRGGQSGPEAAAAFRDNYCKILLDVLEDAKDFTEFKSVLVSVFHDARPAMVEKWKRAVERVRRDAIALDWLERVPSSDDCRYELNVDALELRPRLLTNEPPNRLVQAA